MIDGKTQILGVFGCPIEHTKSPAIQNALLKDCGINAVYLPLATEPEGLEKALAGLRLLDNFAGANVTIPFKEKIIPFLDEISEVSRATGSVNTVYVRDGKLHGTSTDGLGALRNLKENGVSLEGKKVALLGSGGAAKALFHAFLNEGKVASLSVFYGKKEELVGVLENYSPSLPLSEIENHIVISEELPKTLSHKIRSSSETTANSLNLHKNTVRPCRLVGSDNLLTSSSEPTINEFDVICNATPLGMHPNIEKSAVPKELLNSNLTVFDIVYNPLETKLLRDAKNAGCKTVSGIGMLIYQAVESFKLWFPNSEPSPAVIANLIRDLGNN